MTASIAVAPLLVLCSALVLAGCTQPKVAPVTSGSVKSGPAAESTTQAEARPFAVEQSVFEVTYRLDGVILESAAVGIDIPSGIQFRPARESGAVVKKEENLGALVAKSAPADSVRQGTVAESQRGLMETRLRSVSAPLSGRATLSATSVRVEQQGLDVVVPLKPLQELRYRGMDFSGQATVETVLGQRSSRCIAVWIETDDTRAEPAQNDASGSASVHCRLAADIETAPGLPAVLSLKSERIESVVAVPLLYIGLDQSGENYVVRTRQGPAWVERRVVVGATDGARRIVTSGLTAGDVITPIPPP